MTETTKADDPAEPTQKLVPESEVIALQNQIKQLQYVISALVAQRDKANNDLAELQASHALLQSTLNT